jgi:hypothetical protein
MSDSYENPGDIYEKEHEVVEKLIINKKTVDLIRKFRDAIPDFTNILSVVCDGTGIDLWELEEALRDFG